MKPTVRICGDNVSDGDWVVLAYQHPHGPILGLIGRVRDFEGRSQDDEVTHNPWIKVSTNAEPIFLRRTEIQSCCVIDGPHLTSDDMRSLNADLVQPHHRESLA